MKRQKRQLPTQYLLRQLFVYDQDTGEFRRRVDRKKWKAGQLCGTVTPDGYVSINVDYVIYRAHRLAWMYMTGMEPPCFIDHVDGNRLNNRWSNLRLADFSESSTNRRVQKNNKLRTKGVYAYKERFVARIAFRKIKYHLGVFDTINEAKAAYDAASKIIHGAFSST